MTKFICLLLVLVSSSLAVQDRERTIFTKDEKCPVKIKEVRAKMRAVETGRPFVDGDDWLQGLTLELANSSGKTVTYVRVELFFPHPERALKKPGAAISMEYGDSPFYYESAEAMPPLKVKPILSGEQLELTLSYNQHAMIEPLLTTAEIINNDRVEIRVAVLGFSDGTAWSGQMAQRNPKGGWMPLQRTENQ